MGVPWLDSIYRTVTTVKPADREALEEVLGKLQKAGTGDFGSVDSAHPGLYANGFAGSKRVCPERKEREDHKTESRRRYEQAAKQID